MKSSYDKLLLLDRWEKMVPIKHGIERQIRSVTPVARRFVFDSEASRHVGRLLFEAGDLVAEQIAFAKPPYDVTYLEIGDARAMFDGWRPGVDQKKAIPGDDKLGMLYIGNRLYTFCNNDDVEDVPTTLGMFYVDMDRGQKESLAKIFPDNFYPLEHIKLSYLLGGMRQKDRSIAMLRADYDYFLANYDLGSIYDKPNLHLEDIAFMGGGDLIIGAASLLLIHSQRKGVKVNMVPYSRGWHKGKQVVYKAHGQVTIKLGRHETIRRLAFGHRESPRVHDVMGTWVHYHRDRKCEHDWSRLLDMDHERYQCSKCPTIRTWRKPHVRGDGTKGVKIKTYAVTE